MWVCIYEISLLYLTLYHTLFFNFCDHLLKFICFTSEKFMIHLVYIIFVFFRFCCQLRRWTESKAKKIFWYLVILCLSIKSYILEPNTRRRGDGGRQVLLSVVISSCCSLHRREFIIHSKYSCVERHRQTIQGHRTVLLGVNLTNTDERVDQTRRLIQYRLIYSMTDNTQFVKFCCLSQIVLFNQTDDCLTPGASNLVDTNHCERLLTSTQLLILHTHELPYRKFLGQVNHQETFLERFRGIKQ